jgi:DNA-binding NtrC family response regulator
MQEKITALLVHNRPEPMGSIRRALECKFIETQSVKTCGEAQQALSGRRPPHVVLTDPQLPDGSWEDVVRFATEAPSSANVIVVSDVVDIALYLESIQRGAFDFIVPPLPPTDLTYVVHSAFESALRRRETPLSIAARA